MRTPSDATLAGAAAVVPTIRPPAAATALLLLSRRLSLLQSLEYGGVHVLCSANAAAALLLTQSCLGLESLAHESVK